MAFRTWREARAFWNWIAPSLPPGASRLDFLNLIEEVQDDYGLECVSWQMVGKVPFKTGEPIRLILDGVAGRV